MSNPRVALLLRQLSEQGIRIREQRNKLAQIRDLVISTVAEVNFNEDLDKGVKTAQKLSQNLNIELNKPLLKKEKGKPKKKKRYKNIIPE